MKCLLSLLGGMNVLLFFGSMHAHSSHKFLLLAAHSIPRCAWKPGGSSIAQLAISLYGPTCLLAKEAAALGPAHFCGFVSENVGTNLQP